MDLYPAIDLRGGHCVRLLHGDYDAQTTYDDDPARVAREFEAQGARWIHVVDLDAARSGERTQLPQIRAIVDAVSCDVEVGGGVRSVEAAAELLDVGVARVIVGTAAIEDPALVDALCARAPGQVAIGLDAHGDEVATRGWERGAGVQLADAVRAFDRPEVAALIVTQIGVDGTLAGPAVEQYASLLPLTTVPLIASGGVGTLDDLRALQGVDVDGHVLVGVIVGKALYEQRFTVAEAVAALA